MTTAAPNPSDPLVPTPFIPAVAADNPDSVTGLVGAWTGGLGGPPSTTNPGAYIQYNGWTFFSPRFRSRLEMVPEPSGDGRTTLCNTYMLTVRAIVTDDALGYRSHLSSTGDTTNSQTKVRTDQYVARGNLQNIRAKLSKNGGLLRIRGLGFDLEINGGSSDSVFDVRFGPKTKKLEFNSIGNGVVWQVDWVCEFSIPECATTGATGHPDHTAKSAVSGDVSYIGWPYANQGEIESIFFEVGYGISEHGLTNRTISGELSIAINRASATGDGTFDRVPQVADAWRESIKPEVPRDFRRVQQKWDMTSDKRKLRFAITDEELPTRNNYPPGVISMTLDHTSTAASSMLPVMATIACSFSGVIICAKNYPLALAFMRIILILQERLDAARATWLAGGGAEAEPETGNNVMVTEVTLCESLYGENRLAFSISYVILTTSGGAMFGDLVTKSGMFIDTQETSWDEWADSMKSLGVWESRGIAELQFLPEEDVIYGPCDGAGGTALSDRTLPLSVLQEGGSLVTDCPAPGADYLLWRATFDTSTSNNTMISYPMGSEVTSSSQSLDKITSSDDGDVSASYRSPSGADSGPRSSFSSAGSVIEIKIKVMAARMGRECEVPSVNLDKFHEDYAEGKLVPGDETISRGRAGKMGKCAIYTMQATLPYTLTVTSKADIEDIIGSLKDAMEKTASDPVGVKSGGDDGE